MIKEKIFVWVRSMGVRQRLGIAGGLGLLSVFAAVLMFFPLEWVDLKDRWDLWRGQVHRFSPGVGGSTAGLQGLIQDRCAPAPALGKPMTRMDSGCVCVALLHGLGDQASSWKNVLLWPEERWAAMGLREKLRLVALDLPGQESSAQLGVRAQAQAVREFLTPLCSSWIVVGNSWGGWVASWMALDGPQFVTRLILLDSAGLKASREGGAFKEVLSDPTEASLKSFYQKAYFQPKDLPGYYWREIVQKARALSAQHGVLGRAGAHGKADEDLDLRFASLQQLVFLLWGKQDRVIPIEIGYQMRELVKRNAIWREVDGCGHFPQKECPDVVVQSIIDVIHFGLI